MKIRNGFVSNSSSSSFIVMMTKDVYLKATAKMEIPEVLLIEQLCKKDSFLGIDIIHIGYLSVMDGNPFEDLEIPDDISSGDGYNILDDLINHAREIDTNSVISMTYDS